MSIFQKVILALVSVATVPILAMGIYIYWVEREAAVQREMAKLAHTTQQLAAEIDSTLGGQRKLPQHLAEASEVRSFIDLAGRSQADVLGMNQWLVTQNRISQDSQALYLLDRNGTCIASSQPELVGVSYAFRDYYQEGMRGKPFLSDWQIGLMMKGPGLFAASPVRRGTNIIGVIAVRFSTQRIQKSIQSAGDDLTSVFLVNHMGIVLAHTRSNLVYHTIRPLTAAELAQIRDRRQFMDMELPVSALDPQVIQSFQESITANNLAVVKYAFDTREKHGVLIRLGEQRWVLGASIDESLIHQTSRHILHNTLLFTSLALLTALLTALLVCRRLTRPLVALSASIHRFAQGDMTARTAVTGSDEIAELTRAFNQMADTIDAQTQSLNRRVNVLEGILPICAWCKKIRNEHGQYEPLEKYISERSDAKFSHSICEDCLKKFE